MKEQRHPQDRAGSKLDLRSNDIEPVDISQGPEHIRNDHAKFGGRPVLLEENVVRGRQRMEALEKRIDWFSISNRAKGLHGDSLDHRKHVLEAMVQLMNHKLLLSRQSIPFNDRLSQLQLIFYLPC